MTTVTGTLGGPVVGSRSAGSVTFFVVDSEFRRVRNARTAAGTIVEDSIVDLTAGAYSTTLTPQTQIVFPEGSKTARQRGDSIAYLEVPDSGTHDEATITVPDPLAAVAPVELTSRLTRARLGVNSAALTLSFLNFVLVPNTVISVPNIAQTVEVWGVGNIQPSLSGQCAVAIVPEGSTALGTELAIFWAQVLANNNVAGFAMEFDVAPSTPGNYQLAVYGASGTMIVAAKTSLTANAV